MRQVPLAAEPAAVRRQYRTTPAIVPDARRHFFRSLARGMAALAAASLISLHIHECPPLSADGAHAMIIGPLMNGVFSSARLARALRQCNGRRLPGSSGPLGSILQISQP